MHRHLTVGSGSLILIADLSAWNLHVLLVLFSLRRMTIHPLSVDHMINWQREQGVTTLSPKHSSYWLQTHCKHDCK